MMHLALVLLAVLHLQPLIRSLSQQAWLYFLQISALSSFFKVRQVPKIHLFAEVIPSLSICPHPVAVLEQLKQLLLLSPKHAETVGWHCFQVYLRRGVPRLRPFPAALKQWAQPVTTSHDFQYAMLSLLFLGARPIALVCWQAHLYVCLPTALEQQSLQPGLQPQHMHRAHGLA